MIHRKNMIITFNAKVDGIAGGLALVVLSPAGVRPVVLFLHSLTNDFQYSAQSWKFLFDQQLDETWITRD